jgi:N-acyl-D-amino-acid deacylase
MQNINNKYDLVILNGSLIDVVAEKIEKTNIGINKDKIAAVTKENIVGYKQIDASGLLISPGFIDFHSHVDGNLYSAKCLVRQGGTTTLGGERNINVKNVQTIEEEGFIINQGFFISQSFALRNAVGITDMHCPAQAEEISVMADLARSFLEFGAFGICFGLEFVPGTSYEELLVMGKIAKEYERPLSVHLRKDGKEALRYFDEIIQVAEETGASIQILQLMYMVGIGGAMGPALEIIEQARGRGLDITADSGVYDAWSACIGTNIFDPGWEEEYKNTSVNDLLIVSGIHTGECCNEDLFHYLRKNFPGTLVTAFVCDTDAITMALQKDYVLVSTNAADGPHYPGMGAPEVSGTYPRLIGRYVRDKKAIPLIEAIKKITILPAKRFGLRNIGSIEVGKNADIVIFDYESIIDRADFIGRGQPDAPPEGIKYVVVNGDIVIHEGEMTNNLTNGRLIKCESV